MDDRIRPSADYGFYWEFRGKRRVLLGGSVEDNLFQLAGQEGPGGETLKSQLDALVVAGGNYVRCTMSSRDAGNVQPFQKNSSGKYDLEQWEDEYWRRLDVFLKETERLGVVVQIEVWDPWDCYKSSELNPGWAGHPFNPRNNCNYTARESGLPTAIDYFPFEKISPFFETPPALNDNEVVRRYQEAFVGKLMEATLDYGHVLYCVDNETNADPLWAGYWAKFMRRRAQEREVEIYITEMWDNWDPSAGRIASARRQDPEDHPFLERSNAVVTIDHPNLFGFVDVSNHNAQSGPTHFETAIWVRDRIVASGRPRPINCVKIYGADLANGEPATDFGGPEKEGILRFWRNLFAGFAAVRFHRPPAGIGLSPLAQKQIRAARELFTDFMFSLCEPRPDLIETQEGGEAYCFGNPAAGFAIAVFDGVEAEFQCESFDGPATLRHYDLERQEWTEPQNVSSVSYLKILPKNVPVGVLRIESAE